MNNKKISEEIEIDLLDILWKLLIQWRPILVVGIIFALLVPSAKFYKDRKAVNLQKEAITSQLSEEELQELENQLDDTQKNNLNIAVTNARSLIQKQRYRMNSFLTKIDPYNARTLNLQYYITDVKASEAVVLCESYVNQLRQTELILPLTKVMGYDLNKGDTKYVSELLSVSYSGASQVDSKVMPIPMLNISFVLPTDSDADACQKAIVDSVEKLQKSLDKTVATHKIKLLADYTNRSVNTELVSKLDNSQNEVNNLQTNISNAVSGFSVQQKSLYESQVTELEEKYGVTTDGQEYDKEARATASANKILPASFSAKFAVVGFVLGVFLYAFILVMLEILGRKLVTGDELGNATGANCFGKYFSYPAGNGGFLRRLIYSRRLYNIYHRKYVQLQDSAECTAAKISTAVSLMVNDAQNVTLLSLEELDVGCGSYVKCIGDHFKSSLPEGVSYEAMTKSVETLSVKADLIRHLGQVVLVLQCGKTSYETLEKFLELAGEYDIDVIGYIAAE